MGVVVRGLDEAISHMEAMAARARDLSPVLAVIAADTVTVVDDAFEMGVAPGGLAFAPLAPSTIARRRKGTGEGPQTKTLVDRGILRASNNARGEGNRLRFGLSSSYGRYHVTGTRRMPQRNPLPIDGSPGAYVLGSSGSAGRHWARARQMVRDYVVSGRVS